PQSSIRLVANLPPPVRFRYRTATGIELRTQLYREVGHPHVEQASRFQQSAVAPSETARDVTALLEVDEHPPHGPECDIRSGNDVPVRRVNEFWLAQQGEHDSECGRRAASAAPCGSGSMSGRPLAADVDEQSWSPEGRVAGRGDELEIERW